MKILDQYFDLQQQLFDYFSYVEDWVSIPIDDRREYYWQLNQNTDGSGSVLYAKTKNLYETDKYYSDSIYTQRFLPKWVYEGKEYTMICVDTHTDGNKFLAIYANDKRVYNHENVYTHLGILPEELNI